MNYELTEDLKDAFASKYNSQELKIKAPNVVMVFSNNAPNTEELATDRWKVFFIENNELVESQVLENGPGISCSYLKKKKKVRNNRQSYSDNDDELRLC